MSEKPDTLRKIYVKCCATYSKDASEIQFQAWHDVLAEFSPEDVAEALKRWLRSEDIHRERGSLFAAWPPKPIELKVLVRQILAERTGNLRGIFEPCRRQFSDGECVGGSSGYRTVITKSAAGAIDNGVRECDCHKNWRVGKQKRA